MAKYKVVDADKLDTDLKAIADSIRAKGGTTENLDFPADFVSAVGNIETGGGETEEYKGSYEVIPKLEEQIIPTASKVMRNDMKIKEIPIVTVSNSSGGNTKIIG